jgi:hypothetical protein
MCTQLSSTITDTSQVGQELRAVVCLALGAIHRAKGSMALQGVVPVTVEQLVAVASRPTGHTHVWALHGLWLISGAAGPSYSPQVGLCSF